MLERQKPFSTTEALFRSQKHPFHILGPSPYPALVALFLFIWLVPQVFYFHRLALPGRSFFIHLGIIGLYVTVMCWFISIVKESSEGYHTHKVQHGLRLGMILFIVSEVMFFFAFFWAFFHFSLAPSIVIGNIWPPEGSQVLSPWGLPLVNTVLLLSSGVTVTVAHAAIVRGENKKFFSFLCATIVLGLVFLLCQGYEYKYGVKFSWVGNPLGSVFFITTGFHGLHVTIGTLFLMFCCVRHYLTALLYEVVKQGQQPLIYTLLQQFGYTNEGAYKWGFTPAHHFGFEAAAWYWHFVDVVWLFLFICVYWWGGK